VTLYDKDSKLGGQLPLASRPPGKHKIDWFRDYLTTQIKKQNVEIKLETEVTPELVDKIRPDAVILATGSEPLIPDIPGIHGKRVVTARDVLADKIKITKKKVVVAGGGMVGAETAEFLAEQGNTVTIVEQFPHIAYDMELLHRKALMDSLKDKGVLMLTGRKVVEITESQVVAEPSKLPPGAYRPLTGELQSSRGTPPKNERKERLEADWVVLALGVKPVRALADTLEEKTTELHTIGDCEEPQKLLEATYEGSLVARQL
jgi:NADPH-dependent 2,4-dienoyl-CoA reductase/sulfur reductase-like enzyme